MDEESTMMHAILFESTTPLHAAVLADNLSYFKTHYTYDAEFGQLFLIEACLCGSRNIAEHLLTECKSSHKNFPDSLAYIAASMNTEWTKEIALLLAKEKLPMVLDIYRLADDPVIDEIVKIFKTEANKSKTDDASRSTASMTNKGTTSTWLPSFKTDTSSTSTTSSSSTALVQ